MSCLMGFSKVVVNRLHWTTSFSKSLLGCIYMELPLLIIVMDLVGHVLTHRPQPKHLAELKTSFPSESSCLDLNWHRLTHVPQLLHVSWFCRAMYSDATTASGMPNLTNALNEWQQHEQQLQMTSGLSSPLDVKAMCTKPAR